MNITDYLRKIDGTLLFVIFALVFLGILTIGSATHVNVAEEPDRYYFVIRQTLFFVVGFAMAVYSLKYDYHILYKWAPYLYGLNCLMLLAVRFLGTSALGAQRWFQIGPITIQPSEFSKVLMIICLARFFSDHKEGFYTWKSLIPVIALMILPMGLVFIQPDLGTSLIFAAICFGMLYLSDLSIKIIWQACVAFAVFCPFAWQFLLHEYQKTRIKVLFSPEIDPFGSGYHVIQSKISIGSGGFIGKGLFEGTQNQLNFLPENHTDFIFSVIGEEMGFVGAVFLLFLYFILLYRSLVISRVSGDTFGSLISCGIFSMWLFQVFINIGMTIGIMPVTGIPLPFISYGGSALVVNLLCCGLLMNIHLRKKRQMFN